MLQLLLPRMENFPSSHKLHEVASEEALNRPLTHSLHSAELGLAAYFDGKQLLQTDAPREACLPALHSSQITLPAVPAVPAGHFESQDDAPVAENVPAVHGWQMLLVSALAKDPAVQFVHEGAPSPLTDPSKQLLHDDALPAEKVPGEQRVQLPDFSLEKDPGSHNVHEPSPILLFFPASQLMQLVLASLGTSPAEQKLQEVDADDFEIFPVSQLVQISPPPIE